jgi:hypothetical protein
MVQKYKIFFLRFPLMVKRLSDLCYINIHVFYDKEEEEYCDE